MTNEVILIEKTKNLNVKPKGSKENENFYIGWSIVYLVDSILAQLHCIY